jgi:LDH2 family malate/lactate/ureidoglycolate dehydrogenase
LPGIQEIRVPGEGAAKVMAQRLQEGIPMTPELLEALNICAQECKIAPINI